MAEITINQLPLLTAELTDQLEVQKTNNGASGKLTLQQIVDAALAQVPPSSTAWGQITGSISNQSDLQSALSSSAVSAVWGQITGTLSAQTDLQAALNAKANAADVYTVAEVNALLAGKLDTTGGTINGTLTVTGNIVSNADVQAFQP